MTDEHFFVGIRNPSELRKDLITCSRDVVTALIKYEEQYKELRFNKGAQLAELKKAVDDLVFLNKKLRSHLPKTKVMNKVKIKHDCGIKPDKKKEIVKKKVVHKKKTRLEKLKEELAQLDEKVTRIEH